VTVHSVSKPTFLNSYSVQRATTPGTAGPVCRRRLAGMSVGAAIAVGAVIGLALGIVVSVATALPLAPEVGLLLGALGGWRAKKVAGG
jgi:hypothetical protein